MEVTKKEAFWTIEMMMMMITHLLLAFGATRKELLLDDVPLQAGEDAPTPRPVLLIGGSETAAVETGNAGHPAPAAAHHVGSSSEDRSSSSSNSPCQWWDIDDDDTCCCSSSVT